MPQRPDWNDWFLTLAYVIAQRSLDPDTRHGSVACDEDYTPLGFGYNSPPRGCDDSKVPLTRPAKYAWFEHSESNLIINAARTGIPLKDATFFITGHPCEECLRKLINVGAKKVVYGPVGSHCIDQNDIKIMKDMLAGQKISIIEYQDIMRVFEILFQTADYLGTKLGINWRELCNPKN